MSGDWSNLSFAFAHRTALSFSHEGAQPMSWSRGTINSDEHHEPHVTPEQLLFRQVILQAYLDARTNEDPNPLRRQKVIPLTFPETTERRLARSQARAWFIDAGADFREVCSSAGIQPDTVRKNVLQLLGMFERQAA